MTDGVAPARLTVEPLERGILEGVRVAQGDELETVRPDLGLLPVFEDERPLQGLTGFVDWRFCGRLSSLVRSGLFAGTPAESLLLPGRHGLPVSRLVLFGMGRSEDLDEEVAQQRARQLFALASRMHARQVLLAFPGELCRRTASEALLVRLVEEVARGAGEPAQPADTGPAPRAPERWWVVVDARIVSRMRRLVSGPPRAAQSDDGVGAGSRA